jgi:hypothetical protein
VGPGGRIGIGCTGWAIPAGGADAFPEADSRLAAVEIGSSFYRHRRAPGHDRAPGSPPPPRSPRAAPPQPLRAHDRRGGEGRRARDAPGAGAALLLREYRLPAAQLRRAAPAPRRPLRPAGRCPARGVATPRARAGRGGRCAPGHRPRPARGAHRTAHPRPRGPAAAGWTAVMAEKYIRVALRGARVGVMEAPPGSGPRAPRRAPRGQTCRPQEQREPAVLSPDAVGHA